MEMGESCTTSCVAAVLSLLLQLLPVPCPWSTAYLRCFTSISGVSPPYLVFHLHTWGFTSIPGVSPPYLGFHLHTLGFTSIPGFSPPYLGFHLHTWGFTSIPTWVINRSVFAAATWILASVVAVKSTSSTWSRSGFGEVVDVTACSIHISHLSMSCWKISTDQGHPG